MQRLRFFGLVLLIPALAFLAAGTGCGGAKDTGKPAASDGKDGKDAKPSAASGGKKTLEALEWKATATLKGQVTYDGEPPAQPALKIEGNDAAKCAKGDTLDMTWVVDKNTKGVKGVVVWVKAGDGKFFKPESLPESKKKSDKKVELGQPFCNYQPHVLVINPSYFDGKKQVATGMKFIATNKSDGIQHNVKWSSANPLLPENSGNKAVNPGQELEIGVKPAPDSRSGEDLVGLGCEIHKWMTGRMWVLDTPFFAVTDEQGNFEIKDVPAGVEITVIAWHEEAGSNGFVLPKTSPGKGGEKMTLEAGKDKELKFAIKKN